MRIKRLDMVGFKSFMDRTVLAFERGVTGVVGPNGCGKSNVADAVRWVLGEQSAMRLRGRSMEDVVFNGSESKPPLSMAEVMLTFENDRPSELPQQYQGFSEITVGRRLFRSGESEYLVNKTPVRLLDVNDLFFGSGVGRTAYSIIEQGRIGQIVSARPEDRRSIVEEAAGVTKYKRRREAAERKMEATRQNLTRVADIAQELGKRLDSLNRQARKAERFKKVKAQVRELELQLGAARYLELTAQRRAAEDRLAQARTEEAEVGARLAEFEARADLDRAGQEDGERRLQDLGTRERDLETRSRVAAVSAEAAERELGQIAERTAAQAAEVEALKAQAEASAREIEALARQREDLQALGGDDEVRLRETEAALEELVSAEAGILAEVEAARAGASAALSRAAERRTDLGQVDRRRGEVGARLARVRAELDDLAQRGAALDGSRSAQVEKLGRTRQLRLHLEAERGAQEGLLERTRSEFIQNEARLIQVREELSDRRARLESLREVLRNYEGHGRGVRSLMTRAGQGDPGGERGIFGLVADVVSAPPEYETAVEAVLGERLQYVIVESHARGVEAIDWLKSAAEGRASLIPLERLRTGGETPPDPDRQYPGFVATCLEVVRHDPAYEKVVRFLLGDAVIVRDLKSALGLWQSDETRRTLVTLDGEVLDPWGVVTGGPLEGEGHGALQRRREVQELEQTTRAFEAEFALAQDRHRTLQARTAQLEAGLRTLDRDGREKDLLLLDQEKDLDRTGAELERVAGRVAELEAEQAELHAALEALGREEEGHRVEAAAAAAEQSRHEERAREAGERVEELRRRTEALRSELTNLKVKVAAEGERREALGAALDRAQAARAEVEERRQRLYAALSGANGRAAELEQRLEAWGAERAQLEAELGRAREALRAARADHEAVQAAGRAREAEARELRRRAEALAQAAADAALTARENALELSHLEVRIRERCQADVRQELHRFHMEPPPGDEARARLEELEAQAERMGAVNLTAIEEYDELAGRHEFLLGQKADLEASLRDLASAITRINRASRERFRETFDLVNDKFQQVFPRLFSGGRAGLVLTQPENGESGEAGVEIFAQPPGKKLQSVNLLSGGEKALTAVALIFAIFLIKPSPFCLLDEVDAPLDDANVGRFNDLVKEMSQASQFILITHNKRTMEIADTLYGVTMEEPGVSKLVSVRLATGERSAAA
jgi:chromosome segregation protein